MFYLCVLNCLTALQSIIDYWGDTINAIIKRIPGATIKGANLDNYLISSNKYDKSRIGLGGCSKY